MTLENNTNTRRNKRTVLLLKAEPLEKDTRVIKEINALHDAGFDISLITWGICKNITNPLNQIIERTTFSCPRPLGFLHLIFLPFWWLFIIVFALNRKWDLVHVINIHSIIPGIIISRIRRKPLIYEIEDVYEDFIPNLSLRHLMRAMDKKLMDMATAIILVDDAQIEEFSIETDRNMTVIYDSPEDLHILSLEKENYNPNFILFYDGVLNRSRNLLLDKLFTAIKKIDGAQLILCGGGDLDEEIQLWCKNFPEKFSFLGYVSYDDVIRNSQKANLLPAIRSSLPTEIEHNCGSKLLKSMMCGKPSLVNKGTSGERIVREEQCGIIVDATDVNELVKSIELLKNDPVLCLNLGKNARTAYEERYGWHIMKMKLITLYDSLLTTPK